MDDHTELTEAERAIMLERCDCGHTINDHGSLAACWVCTDDGGDCETPFESLLVERVASLVAARVSVLSRDLAAQNTRIAAVEGLPRKWLTDPDGLPRGDGCAAQLLDALSVSDPGQDKGHEFNWQSGFCACGWAGPSIDEVPAAHAAHVASVGVRRG